MSWVWLTVTERFWNSLYMNHSELDWLVRSAFVPTPVVPVMAVLVLSSRPEVQLAVTAEAVCPTPDIWS